MWYEWAVAALIGAIVGDLTGRAVRRTWKRYRNGHWL